jgi:hypothetical protein
MDVSIGILKVTFTRFPDYLLMLQLNGFVAAAATRGGSDPLSKASKCLAC